MPKRLVRSRRKGYRMPEGAVYVGRPTKWGNPFKVDSCIEEGFADNEKDARLLCVTSFRSWLTDDASPWAFFSGEERRAALLPSLNELRGRDLVCWCPLDQPCHADVLLELANA